MRAGHLALETRQEAQVEKVVIRTEEAPGPFQGAPYNQAIRVGEKAFGVVRQKLARPTQEGR